MASKAGAIRAGRAFVELFADREGLERDLKKAEARLKAFGNNITSIGSSFAKMGALVTAPLLAAAAATVKLGDDLDKMSRRTGVSVEALSALGFAAEQSGADVDAVQKSLFRMQRTIGDAARGSTTAVKALADLGLTYEQLAKMKPEDQFKLIADRLNQMGDANVQAAIGQEVLGRGFRDVLPLIQEGADGIEAYMRQADELGITMSKEMADAAKDMADELNIMRKVLRSVTLAVGSALLPVLKDAVQWISENGQKLRQWVEENEGLIRTVLKVGAVVGAAGVALILLGKIIGGVAAGVAVLNTALMFLAAHPIIAALMIIAAGFVAVTVALRRLNQTASDHADQLQRINEANEKARDADRNRLARLDELSQKQELSNDEMREAANLIALLEGRYGDLGVVLDETARKLENVAEAQEAANREMLKQKFSDLFAEMDARRKAVEQLEQSIAQREAVIAADPLRRDGSDGNSARNIARVAEERKQLEAELARLEEINRRIIELRTGGGQEAETADVPAGEVGAIDAVNDHAERWARRVHQLKLQQIEDEFEREMALLNERYDHEIKQAADNAAAIEQIEKARELELEALRDRHRQRRLDEEKRAADEAARHRERVERLDQQQHRTVEELRLRATLEGVELEAALLDLRERQALEDATRNEQNLDLVREEFALRREMLARQQEVADAIDRFGAMGTFATRGIGQMLGGIVGLSGDFGDGDADERTADNTRGILDLLDGEIAEDVRWLVRRASEGGALTFGA